MIAHHIHDALAQVKQLQALILEKRLFRGYSGIGRMAGGLVALAGMIVMATPRFPSAPNAHLLGWLTVLIIALAINYGMLMLWFSTIPASRRSIRELMPAIDAIPALAIGAVFSLALVMHGFYDLLFGAWMCLYGLVHMPYRNSLPFANYLVGIFYLLCGAIMLLWPGASFTNPYPMGLVFGFGELGGGFVLYQLNKETVLEQEEETEHDSKNG